ncbi:Hypothetical predicted protein [Pelobates cultripes]|uniref:Uncharacterized protein n=1 Tax=Pelobates cultripes TaxID=61616 RepID=A0AAD1S0S5_PELCU|nr:Hypothetical predicted protein [Pelobates cultripes]
MAAVCERKHNGEPRERQVSEINRTDAAVKGWLLPAPTLALPFIPMGQISPQERRYSVNHSAKRSTNFAIHSYGTNFATRTTIFREPFGETFHKVIAIRSGTICTLW